MVHGDYLMRTLQQLAHTLAALFGGARGRDLAETMARLDAISATFTGLSLPVLRGLSYDDLRGLFSAGGTFAVERGYAAARVLHADAVIASERGAGFSAAQALTSFRLLADVATELGGFADEQHEEAFTAVHELLRGAPTNAAAAEKVFQAFRAADRVRLFDGWAEHYDRSTGDAEGFPFEGYERVLDEVVRTAGASAGMTVLDLGIGTGNLAAHFARLGCDLWGVDSSREMLAKARDKLPSATLVLADLPGVWLAELELRFDRIVSSYVLHEFDLATKLRLLRRLAERGLAPDGSIVVGDVAFATSREREAAHAKWADAWDDDEHYWAADETQEACRGAGLRVGYRQVSSCAGAFVFEPASPERAGAGDG